MLREPSAVVFVVRLVNYKMVGINFGGAGGDGASVIGSMDAGSTRRPELGTASNQTSSSRFMITFLVKLRAGLARYQLALQANQRARFYALHVPG